MQTDCFPSIVFLPESLGRPVMALLYPIYAGFWLGFCVPDSRNWSACRKWHANCKPGWSGLYFGSLLWVLLLVAVGMMLNGILDYLSL